MTDEKFKFAFPFPEPREGQRDIVERVVNAFDCGKKNVILSAPTAVGKSVLAVTIARYLNHRSYFLTSQKTLQDQYMKDFESFGMKTVKGKYNYRCAREPMLKCDMGVCEMVPASKKGLACGDCPYDVAKKTAFESPMTLMNYAYFFNMVRAEYKGLDERELLVCDETHNVENELINFASVTLSKKDFSTFKLKFKFRMPSARDNDDQCFSWLEKTALPELMMELQEQIRELQTMDENDAGRYSQSRRTKFLDTLICMTNRMLERYHDGTPGLCERDDSSCNFRLIFAREFSNDFLFRFGKKRLLMSATIFNPSGMCEMLNLKSDETEYVECDSPIPPKSRPVCIIGTVNLAKAHKEKNLPVLVTNVDKILRKHAGQRGIVHTVSYDVAHYILEHSVPDVQQRLLIPTGKERDDIINEFMTSPENDLVLISPSLTEGISLDNDLSRFTVVCKIPFPYLGDRWVQIRKDFSQEWYDDEVIKTLVQMTGRSVRSKDDYAVAYVLDSNFNWFFARNAARFPKWWRSSLVLPRNNR